MSDQIGFDFVSGNRPSGEGLDREPTPSGESGNLYPIELAFRLLGMMAGEALYYLEEIAKKAKGSDEEEIAALARRAINVLTDEPTRDFVNASAVRPRAIQISKDCNYG